VTPVDAAKRPTRVSSLVSVAAVLVALALLADTGPARLSVIVSGLGVGLAASGSALIRRNSRAVGLSIVLIGVVFVPLAAALAVTRIGTPGSVLVVVPGLIGLAVLATGLVPVRWGWARPLVKGGTALVVLGALHAAAFRLATLPVVLSAVLLSVVAWDAAENAIGLGDQLGQTAETTAIELVHVGGTVAVGGVGVTAAMLVSDLRLTGGSLGALVLMLAAMVLLVAALHG